MNMTIYHFFSSSLRWRIASLIRLVSFLPLCSPILTFILAITLRHPASTFILATSSLLIASFLRFYCALSTFYCSFFVRYSSSCFLPSAFRPSLSLHSFSLFILKLRSFREEDFEYASLPTLYVLLSNPPKSHWNRFIKLAMLLHQCLPTFLKRHYTRTGWVELVLIRRDSTIWVWCGCCELELLRSIVWGCVDGLWWLWCIISDKKFLHCLGFTYV